MSRARKAGSRRRAPARPAVRPQTPAETAAEMEREAAAVPAYSHEILRDAASQWELAGDYGRALALWDRLLTEDCEDRHLVGAFRIGTLLKAGRRDDVRDAARQLRAERPSEPDAWYFVGEAFEESGEEADLRTAAEWYTAGIAHVLGPDPTADDARGGGLRCDMLFTGRHRVRRLQGQPHDDWDELAHTVHDAQPLMLRGAESLDDKHDPMRLRGRRVLARGHGVPDNTPVDDEDDAARAELEAARAERERLTAETEHLRAEIEQRRAARRRPATWCEVHFPEPEYAEVLRRWPTFAETCGNTYEDHRRQVQRDLQEQSDEGELHLAVGPGTAEGLAEFAGGDGEPVDGDTARNALVAYADDLDARDVVTHWPPPRNGRCWCDSGRKYKKCCGAPAGN